MAGISVWCYTMTFHFSFWLLFLRLASIVVLLTPTEILAVKASEPVISTNPSDSVLLFGDRTVASTSRLTQTFFSAKKHLANPIMRRAEPWEGVGPYLWGSR